MSDYGREVASATTGFDPSMRYAQRDAAGPAQVQRLRPPVSDRQVHLVASVLLDFRHSPMGEIEMARIIIDALDNYRFSPDGGY